VFEDKSKLHVMQCRWQLVTDVSEALCPSEMSFYYLKADKQDLNLYHHHSETSNFASQVSVNDVASNEMVHREINQSERLTNPSLFVDIPDTKPNPSSSLRYCPSSHLIMDEASN
jgi:hypothetical protein